MTHIEYLGDDKGCYEIRHNDYGAAIHVYILDSDAIIFPSLDELIRYVYLGDRDMKYISIPVGALEELYESKHYDYRSIKHKAYELASKYSEQ
jgi:hypothetical protein